MTDGANDTQLRSIVERVISRKTDIADANADIADIYKEAASNGYDKQALKEAVKIMMEDADKRQKRAATNDTVSIYLSALGIA